MVLRGDDNRGGAESRAAFSGAPRGGNLLGWTALIGASLLTLGRGEWAVFASTIILSEMAVRLLLSGQPAKTNQAIVPLSALSLFLRWLALLIPVLALTAFLPPFLFLHHPGAHLAFAALPVVRALTWQAGQHRPGDRFGMVRPYPFVVAALLISAERLDALSANGAALLALFAALCLYASALAFQPRQSLSELPGKGADPALVVIGYGRLLRPHLDLLLLPFLFGPAAAFTYLVARLGAYPVTLVLNQIELRARRPLLQAILRNQPAEFARNAARINLGALFLGAATALLVLSCVTALPGLFGENRALVLWLVAAAAARAFLGLAAFFADLTELRRAETIANFAAIALVPLSAFVVGVTDLVGLARLCALSEWISLGIMAGLLAQKRGIWPGITAVFARQIRLFES